MPGRAMSRHPKARIVRLSAQQAPGLLQEDLMLPLPGLSDPAQDEALYRGAADHTAFWLRYHVLDQEKGAPRSAAVEACQEALEHVRVDILGIKRILYK